MGGGGLTFTVSRGRVSGEFAITSAWSTAKDFGSDGRAVNVKLRNAL
jgi:hypothetical protein